MTFWGQKRDDDGVPLYMLAKSRFFSRCILVAVVMFSETR